jgi:hypothetical protein
VKVADYLEVWAQSTLAQGEPEGLVDRLRVWWNPVHALPLESRPRVAQLVADQATAVAELSQAGVSLFSVRKREGEWEYLDYQRRGPIALPLLSLVVHFEPDDLTQVPNLEGVGHLNALTTLVHLELSHPKLTDAHCTQLSALQVLESLVLGGEREVTDATLEVVGQLSSLRTLRIRGGSFTDAGLRALAGLRLVSLEISNFFGEAFSDEALTCLHESQTLERLKLGLNDAQREALQTALPQCQIS